MTYNAPYMDIAAMGRVDWIWFFTQTYPERFQIPSFQIKNCNIFGNSLRDHTESHCCNFQGIGVVFERSISWWFEHKLQQLPLKCWWHLMYSTFEPSLVLVTNRVRFACYSHCWFPGEVQCVFTKSANTATNIRGGYPEVQGTCTPIAINILHIMCKYPINLLHPKFYLYGHRMTSLP
jgi:hypothetical protein